MKLGRVLVVDDEQEVAAALHDNLLEIGYSAKTALNGHEALALMSTFQPDLVLLDVMMPGLTGDEILERLRQQNPDVPVVMVTALTDEDRARALLARGAFDYVGKPFDFEVLQRVVGAAVASRR